MDKIRLGKTNLMVTKTSMGCLPVQRRDMAEAVRILRRAYEAGINYFDTANGYTDSEEKIGNALSDVRDKIIISTKSMARDYKGCKAHIENSLRMMKTDYIDIFQFHMVKECPDPNDKNGAYAAAYEMMEKGYIGHIGVTTHMQVLSFELVDSGLFETMQYPFCHISQPKDYELVEKCAKEDVGFIAMKGLAGGLLDNARACYAFMKDYPVVPIWGIQTMEELEEWIALDKENPSLDDELRAVIEKDRRELMGNFCRGCGYCMPCPAGIEINNSARMNMFLRRAPYRPYMTEEWYEKMHRIENCIECGQCMSKCPYELNTPEILKYMLKDYDEFYAVHKND